MARMLPVYACLALLAACATETAATAAAHTRQTEQNAAAPSIVNICLGRPETNSAEQSSNQRCLSAVGTEFTSPIMNFDVSTAFRIFGRSQTIQRLSDRLCMDAKEVEGSYVFGFVACSKAASWAYEPDKAQLTLLSNATESLCFASDEGYGSVMACSTARPAQVEIAFLPVTEDTRTDEAKLQDMLMMMEGSERLFWARTWDIAVGSAIPEQDAETIDLARLNGAPLPLWRVINECRSRCELASWCQSFEVRSGSKQCVLSRAGAAEAKSRIEEPGTILAVRTAISADRSPALPILASPMQI